jgi:hypothetical protein
MGEEPAILRAMTLRLNYIDTNITISKVGTIMEITKR